MDGTPLPLIEAEGLSKKFAMLPQDVRRYGTRDFLRIAFGLPRELPLRPGEFWALDNLSFSLAPGESLAVLGRNGAGKSTLLKLITGHMLPDAGTLTVRGSVGVLAIGQFGFQSLMTGRDNIVQKAVALGMRKQDILPLVPEIIEFADIGPFIDAPVRSYSSGMVARLGFAVAIHVNPDILLADEALSAGDAEFARKCAERIAEMRRRMSFVIVTHSPDFARDICTHAIVLERGRAVFSGTASDAADFYQGMIGRDAVSTVSA